MKKKNKVQKVLTLLKETFFPAEKKIHASETSKVRHLVLNYCNGAGADIGFGGDKIIKENCLGIDLKKPYGYTGLDKVDLACNLHKEKLPVENSCLDYVYTSHLIEDFEDTNKVLLDFFRVLKTGGNLILVFPDQVVYEKYCIDNNHHLNNHHIHKDMGLDFMKKRLSELTKKHQINFEILYENNCEIDYNVILIVKKM